MPDSQPVGRILGTEDSTPLDFWVGLQEDAYLQLDDVVMVETEVPGGERVRISGVVDMVRAHHEGARFDSDVFLAERGLLPVETARAAHVVATRFEPELYVPPQPGDQVVRGAGDPGSIAPHFDAMEEPPPAGPAARADPHPGAPRVR